MDQFYDQTNGRMAEWVSQLEPWVKACENLGNMECYQGKSAESVKTYLKEVHMTLLTSIQQAIQLYRTNYLFYREGYYDMEGDLYAVIPQKTLLSVKDRMKTEIEDVSDSSLIVQTSLLNVSDLIALQAPNSYYLKDSMEEVKQNVTDFNQNIIDYEAQHKSEANGELADLLQSLFATLTEYYTNGTNVTSYQSGDCFGNSHMPELCQHVLTANEYLKENAEEIELAEVKMQEVFAQQYEDACKAREEEGAIKLLTGGAAAITGILAIVGTGGMATPVVIGVWVTGGSTALYGASKAIEGIQDVHYGRAKDLTSKSFNFIRDTVFQGNQEAYDAWGNINMMVAGLLVPIGQGTKAGAGLGVKAIARESAKRVAKEAVKDMAVDFTAETMTNWAREELDLGDFQTELLKTGLEFGLDKGLGKVGSKHVPFTDDMTFSGDFDEVKVISFVRKSLKDLQLTINDAKTRVRKQGQQQEVTGIVVNYKPQLAKSVRKGIRKDVYYINKYGLQSHLKYVQEERSNYLEHLFGLINYALFINPNDEEMKRYKIDIKYLMKKENDEFK